MDIKDAAKAIDLEIMEFYRNLHQKYPELRGVVMVGEYDKGAFTLGTYDTKEQVIQLLGRTLHRMAGKDPEHSSRYKIDLATGKIEDLPDDFNDGEKEIMIIHPDMEPN